MTDSELLLLWSDTAPAKPLPRPPEKPLPRLVTAGQFFALDTGERFTAIECSDFQLLQRYLHGADLRPVLAQRRDCGYNIVRVLGMCAGMFWLKPQEEPKYWSGVRDLCALCATYGVYVELTVFADATVIMPLPGMQLQHWEMVGRTLYGGPSLLVEAVNEADQTINRLASLMDLEPLPGLLCSHGSNGSEQLPVRPWWDYETFHTNGAYQWPRKVGHNAAELSWGAETVPASNVPVVANENTRYPDRSQSLTNAYDAAAGAALLCAGSCFHSVHGKTSELWVGLELDAAKAWAAGARSVPLHCQSGHYRHRDDLEQQNAGQTGERVYQRGVNEACIVRVGPS